MADLDWLASPDGLAMAVWLGAIPTALAYLLFAHGLRLLPASEMAALTLAEPVTAAALGAIVLGERPGAPAVAGIALVIAGLAVLALRGQRADPVPAGEGRCREPAGLDPPVPSHEPAQRALPLSCPGRAGRAGGGGGRLWPPAVERSRLAWLVAVVIVAGLPARAQVPDLQ